MNRHLHYLIPGALGKISREAVNLLNNGNVPESYLKELNKVSVQCRHESHSTDLRRANAYYVSVAIK